MLAHTGHWLTSVLYVAPVLLVLIAMWVQGRRSKGKEDEPEDREPTLDDVMDGRA